MDYTNFLFAHKVTGEIIISPPCITLNNLIYMFFEVSITNRKYVAIKVE